MKRGDDYKREKLEASIVAAGATADVPKKIPSYIKVREGMSILEMRKQVSDQLKTRDPKAAKAYGHIQKQVAKRPSFLMQGFESFYGDSEIGATRVVFFPVDIYHENRNTVS